MAADYAPLLSSTPLVALPMPEGRRRTAGLWSGVAGPIWCLRLCRGHRRAVCLIAADLAALLGPGARPSRTAAALRILAGSG